MLLAKFIDLRLHLGLFDRLFIEPAA